MLMMLFGLTVNESILLQDHEKFSQQWRLDHDRTGDDRPGLLASHPIRTRSVAVL